jgi:hypothetical protein
MASTPTWIVSENLKPLLCLGELAEDGARAVFQQNDRTIASMEFRRKGGWPRRTGDEEGQLHVVSQVESLLDESRNSLLQVP